MTKQKTLGIDNAENYLRLTLRKEKTFIPFLRDLLEVLDIEYHRIEDYMGNPRNILETEDKSFVWSSENSSVYEIIGNQKIFLFIHTDKREKLKDFILEYCDFVKKKNDK